MSDQETPRDTDPISTFADKLGWLSSVHRKKVRLRVISSGEWSFLCEMPSGRIFPRCVAWIGSFDTPEAAYHAAERAGMSFTSIEAPIIRRLN